MKKMITSTRVRDLLAEKISAKFGDRLDELTRHPEDREAPEGILDWWSPVLPNTERGELRAELEISFSWCHLDSNSLNLSFNPWRLRDNEAYGPVHDEDGLGMFIRRSAYKVDFEWRVNTGSLLNCRDIETLDLRSQQHRLLAEIAVFSSKFVEELREENDFVALYTFENRPTIQMESNYNGSTRMWTIRPKVTLDYGSDPVYGLPDPSGELRERFKAYHWDRFEEDLSDGSVTEEYVVDLYLRRSSLLFSPEGVSVKGKGKKDDLIELMQDIFRDNKFKQTLWPDPPPIPFDEWHSQWEASGCPQGER